jgi:hypothetical protein
MSKKLIAVAAAAALALTGLVATPATSAVGAFSVTVVGERAGSGLTEGAAFTINVPSQNVLRYVDTASATTNEAITVSAVRVNVVTPGTTDAVRVTAAGGAKVLTKTAFDDATTKSITLGAASADSAGTASSAGETSFIVYTTSTTASQVTVTSGSNSSSFWIKGVSPASYAYNVVVKSPPATLATSVDTDVDFTVTDAFGNAVEETLAATITKVGNVNLSTATALTWDTDRKTLELVINGSAAGNASINVALGATKITAFGDPKTAFFTVAVGGTQAELITSLNAQVAALKADYNALAAKWNKRVASKKAPKKAVALK